MLNKLVKLEITKLLRNPDFRKNIDKKLLGGYKDYIEYIEKLDDNAGDNVGITNPKCKRFLMNAQQKLVSNMCVTYANKIGSVSDATQSRFITDVVVSSIIAFYKLIEINAILVKASSNSVDPLSLGFYGTFVQKVLIALNMMEDVSNNFDKYLKPSVSTADCKYIEVGLRRMLAAEVDEIV